MTIAFWPIPGCRKMLGREVSGTISAVARDRHGGRAQGDPCRARGRSFPNSSFRDPCGPACTPRRSRPSPIRARPICGWRSSHPSTSFFANILSRARTAVLPRPLGFVAMMVPIVFLIGFAALKVAAGPLAEETDRIQRFETISGAAGALGPSARSMDLGRSVSTIAQPWRRRFSRFVPRRLVEKN